ncbi:unnamed protein product, partial [Chrysoparadoxa australica]
MGREHHPEDPRLQDRTLAVLHAAGERDAFIADVRNIFPRPDPDDQRWREAAAMGRELAPDEDMFVDVPPPASQQLTEPTESDFAANTREFEAMLASFDAGDAPGPAAEPVRREPESAPAPHADEAGIDLDPDQFDFEVESGSTIQPAAGDDAVSSDPLAFDIGDLSVGD